MNLFIWTYVFLLAVIVIKFPPYYHLGLFQEHFLFDKVLGILKPTPYSILRDQRRYSMKVDIFCGIKTFNFKTEVAYISLVYKY